MKITKQVSMHPLTVSLSLLILLVAGFGGMSVVWMRTKISQSADRISQVETEQKKVNRRLQDIGAKIAESHTPEVLKAGIPASVRPSLQEQIIWVPDSYGDPQQIASSNP
jgi:hypothetical protein